MGRREGWKGGRKEKREKEGKIIVKNKREKLRESKKRRKRKQEMLMLP